MFRRDLVAPVSLTRLPWSILAALVFLAQLSGCGEVLSYESVSGRVTNERGEPLEGVYVTILAKRYINGRWDYHSVNDITETGSEGRYDLPVRLPPSDYLVQVNGCGILPALVARQGSISQTDHFGVAYYPGTTDPGEAVPITWTGLSITGLDVKLPALSVATVSGVVVGPDGDPVQRGGVMMRGNHQCVRQSPRIDSEGRFTFRQVHPGSHTVVYRWSDGNDFVREMAYEPITVKGDEDIDDLVLTTTATGLIRGRVSVEGQDAPSFDPLRAKIVTIKDAGVPSYPSPEAGLFGDYTFELDTHPGPRFVRFRIGHPPSGLFPRAILLSGRDVTEIPIDFTMLPADSALEIVLTDKLTELSGEVIDVSGPPALVVAFPDNPDRVTPFVPKDRGRESRYTSRTYTDAAG